MTNFSFIGLVDVVEAVCDLSAHGERFSDETSRQNYPGTAHPDSETIYLRWAPEKSVGAAFNCISPVDYPAWDIKGFRQPVLTAVDMLGANLARAMVIKLRAGGVIHEHTDQGPYADATDRFHIPIMTNDASWLRCGDDIVSMGLGEIWSFNKHTLHSGANEGKEDRVHIVFDVFKDRV
jgi:Aspartyl/Asparaginyl beta-hydroxylase